MEAMQTLANFDHPVALTRTWNVNDGLSGRPNLRKHEIEMLALGYIASDESLMQCRDIG